MKAMSRLKIESPTRAALAACLCLLLGAHAHAQGDLTSGVGQFAIQPKKERAVVSAKPKPPAVKAGPRATANERLLAAAGEGSAAAVAGSPKQGADVNARADDGWTPLLWASWFGHADVVKLLLAHGADVNARDKDTDTALMKAATQGHADVVQMLLDKGAEADARGNGGG